MSMPVNGAMYKLYGDDCWGDFTVIAKCVHYKSTRSLNATQKKYGYRWLTAKDCIISHCEVNEFKLESKGK